MPASLSSTTHWHLIQCKARQDERAELNLSNQGFVCYRPVHEVERLRHGRRVLLQESLFPGYIFIRLDCLADNWSAIRSTRGVLKLVSFGTEPTPVEPAIIYSIQSRSQKAATPSLQQGDAVRILQGPFRDLEAIFLRADGTERAVLLLNLLQRQQQLKFSLNAIEPVPCQSRVG
ncbi:MAG: transcription/translation regulatory transformer protein RfaH [Pseudoalteromonas distincta]